MNGRLFRSSVALVLLLLAQAVQAAPVNLKGTLRQGACTLRPGDEDIRIDMLEVVNKYLYLNNRTPGKDFSLHLEACDISVVKGVTVTFKGTDSVPLPGLLALDAGSTASGVAIGMESSTGVRLPFNTASPEYTLVAGNNVIALRAYVQGEPDAIANQTIGLGAFRASATFELNYQ